MIDFGKITRFFSKKKRIAWDAMDLDVALAGWILPRLECLRCEDFVYGYPVSVLTDESLIAAAIGDGYVMKNDSDLDGVALWKYVLDRMIYSFRYIILDPTPVSICKEKYVRYEYGIELFRKYLRCLWS